MPRKDAKIKPRYSSKYFLPEEVISLIIALGTLDDMKRWRQVSRTFKAVVDKSPIFQYLVLLKQLGYIEPINPRQDLTYREKIEMLRGHRRKLQSLTASDYVSIDSRPQGAEGNTTPFQFFRGLFAYLVPADDPEDIEPDQLFIYELPSFQRPLSQCENWSVYSLGPSAKYHVDKSMDLVVFFMYVENHSCPHLVVDLRSFHDGGDHPAAAKPRLEFPVTDPLEDICWSINGDYLTVLLDTDSSDDSYDIVTWDWPSGEQVMRTQIQGCDSFTFVMPNVLIVPSSLSYGDGNIELIGYLDIFTFDPNGKKEAPRHVATLQLPATPDKNATTYVTVCPSHSPFLKSRTVPESKTEARLYDVSPDDGVVCVKITCFPGAEDAENVTYPRPLCSGLLLIHHESITEIIHSLPQTPHHHVVPWSEWAHKAVWTGASVDDILLNQFSTFGHLVTLLRERKVIVYDVRPCFLNIDIDSDDRTYRPQNYPSQPARATPLDSWFGTGENRARSPKVLSLFALPRKFSLVEPTIIINDEHVILAQDSEWDDGSEFYLYSLYESSEKLPQHFSFGPLLPDRGSDRQLGDGGPRS